MQLSMKNWDFAFRKLITMIAERDAAILERNCAIAEKAVACEERDAALLLRDAAYADRDSALEERDAAVAALETAVNSSVVAEKRGLPRDAKLFQNLSMAKCGNIAEITHAPAASEVRRISCVQEEHDVRRFADTKEVFGALPISRKRTLVVKSSLERPLRAKKPCRGLTSAYRYNADDREGAKYLKIPNAAVRVNCGRYPTPHCSCTGLRQQCYRWGNGGWQSSCCTTMISMYPLPMNPTKKGSRLAGRKMSAGAFQKLLDKLKCEEITVNTPVDLKDHWAKHGTNRYVTLR